MENNYNILKAQLIQEELKGYVKHSLWNQYLSYRIYKLIQLTINSNHENKVKMNAINFEQKFKKFQKAILESTTLHLRIWSSLSDETPSYLQFITICTQLYKSINLIYTIWERLQRNYNNVPRALSLFAEYKLEVENDEKGYIYLINLYIYIYIYIYIYRMSNMSKNTQNKRYNALGIKSYEDLTHQGAGIVMISGEYSKLGMINDCNLAICSMFGHPKNNMIAKQVEILMPKFYANFHHKILSKKNEYRSENEELSKWDHFAFGRHASGYIFPLMIYFADLPSIGNLANYVAIFSSAPKITERDMFLLVDLKTNIVDLTSSTLIFILYT